MCLPAEAESSCSRLHGCLCSSAPAPSPILPPRGWYQRPSIHSGHSPFQGAKWAPILTQILPKLLFSFPRSAERQASLHRCSLGEDDSLSSGGLSSSCVALRLSAGGFPAGHGCSYTLDNTAAVVLQTAPLRSKDGTSTAICATADMFAVFEVSGWSGVLSKRLLTPRRRTFVQRGGANTEVKPERSKIKKKTAVKWFKSWLVGDLTEQRH